MADETLPQKTKTVAPRKKTTKAKADKSKKVVSSFPIVGIGASAGGLEAFEIFFTHAKVDSGIAFVLISHLDPGHVSMLTEILQRVTKMAVLEATDGMKLEPNHVYVIPPNRDMILFKGALRLSMPTTPRGFRMPIDFFLRSLAKEQGEKAIGVILSGTGSDGTLGLRDIHSQGGISIVQDPAQAKYDGMPSSAIKSGYSTYTLLVEKMPEILEKTLSYLSVRQGLKASEEVSTGVNQILKMVLSSTGHDFSLYKKSTIIRRIDRRMAQHNIESTEVYLNYLRKFPDETKNLYKEFLINVTSFFRDPIAFQLLGEEILPKLLAKKTEGLPFRVWVAGCSTGEEAYSIAILLAEVMERESQDFNVQIYATDLDEDAINLARRGVYVHNIVEDMTPERLRRFFVKDHESFRVKKEIRDMVVFAVQNVIKDPPFTKLDFLSCRNLMIYLEYELQARLIKTFHYALKPGGVLFLSPSENVGNDSQLFDPLSRKWKVYRSSDANGSAYASISNGLSWSPGPGAKNPESAKSTPKEVNFPDLIRRALLQSYAPALVVTNLRGDIFFVHGETGKYLELPSGQPVLNVIAMARDGLQQDLRESIHNAATLNTPILNREVLIKTSDALLALVFSVRPMPDPDSHQILFLITFQDVSIPRIEKAGRGKRGGMTVEKQRIQELEQALTVAKEKLQSTIEEQQVSNEELKSTNEELQSTNEELQSTNEELETSKEELQSINEELITVNAEFQEKIEQLDTMQNDMKNLLDSMDVGTIFLDLHLCIRRFSREAGKVYRLIASDIGRPLGDIKSNLVHDDLLIDAKAVLNTLVSRESEVRTTNKDYWLVRIQPYQTLDNVILGVVMTFTNVTKIIASTEMEKENALADDIINTVIDPLVGLDSELNVISANIAFYREFRLTSDETIGHSIYEVGNQQWKIPEFQKLLELVLPYNRSFDGYTVEYNVPGGGRRKIIVNGRRIINKKVSAPLILLAMKLLVPGQEETK